MYLAVTSPIRLFSLVLVVTAVLRSPAAEPIFLEQNWDDATRQFFYTTSQGSRLVPYDWFLALETSGTNQRFAQDRLLELGFLANRKHPGNPDGLPVGFVKDVDWSGKSHLGLTCAACHTSQLRLEEKTYQIDGGPTLADVWGLLSGIGTALNETLHDETKWRRFAEKVLGSGSVDSSGLRDDVTQFNEYYQAFIEGSRTPHGWGRGRLDAFGMIFNRVSSIDLDLPQNSQPPDAPVSYPFLWGTSWQNQVQWNGAAPNTNDIERLGRNLGEVLGVFAQAELEKASIFKPFYRTSARRLNQVRIENRLKKLWSPAWPTEVKPLDSARVGRGRQLFNANCVGCHEVVPHGQQNRPVEVVMTPLSELKTDPRMATNAATRSSLTGRLEGSRVPGLDPLPAKVATGSLLQNVGRGALLSPFLDVSETVRTLNLKLGPRELFNRLKSQAVTEADLAAFLKELELSQDQVHELVQQYELKLRKYVQDLRVTSNEFPEGTLFLTASAQQAARERVLAYKGRPLDGIWATAPYLHNGSVPNLYELLLPAGERSTTFHVGSIEFDPVRVGFNTDAGASTTLFDTTLPGNSNTGHDTYGTFDEGERWALVEYMKSL